MEPDKEMTTQEKLAQVNANLNSLKATETACAKILENKTIKIVDLSDTSEDPLSLTLSGNAVVAVLRPIIQGVESNRNQMIAIKEQLLALIEQEIAKKA
ncbi:hypothetical protein KBB74_02645 [Candidatus Parcubacteria bacterium]|nr:hypothetical protein [Candidatus Parcubacteria bacterium]